MNSSSVTQVKQHTCLLDIKECFGERLTELVLRGEALARGGVLRRVSLRGTEPAVNPDRAGRTATAPGSAPADFLLLLGGMREAGKVDGRGSCSMVLYTRCIA